MMQLAKRLLQNVKGSFNPLQNVDKSNSDGIHFTFICEETQN